MLCGAVSVCVCCIELDSVLFSTVTQWKRFVRTKCNQMQFEIQCNSVPFVLTHTHTVCWSGYEAVMNILCNKRMSEIQMSKLMRFGEKGFRMGCPHRCVYETIVVSRSQLQSQSHSRTVPTRIMDSIQLERWRRRYRCSTISRCARPIELSDISQSFTNSYLPRKYFRNTAMTDP